MINIDDLFEFSNEKTLKNRIIMAPMTTKMSFFDGVVTNDELEYYRMRSGEVGAVITGAANVQENGKGWEGELGVYDDRFIPGLSKLASAIKLRGTKAILQIFHAGRMTNSAILRGEQPLAPSAIAAEREGAEIPREIDSSEIYELIDSFKQATKRAVKAGFDGVELHGANTFIIQQFFSPHSNRRNDQWGGSLEHRFSFIDILIDEITDMLNSLNAKDFIVGYRFSPEEFENPGIKFEDTLYLVDKLAEKSLSYLHISLNNFKKISLSEDYQEKTMLEYVSSVVNKRIPIVGVGDVRTGEDVKKVLKYADLVAVGRSLVIDPHWTSKVINQRENLIRKTLNQYDLEELKIGNGVLGFLELSMPERLIKSFD